MRTNQNILDNTLKSATLNVLLQVFVKGITFFLNALSLRYVSKDVIGVVNVRLLLLESTVLFLSREAFRKAALSQMESQSWQQVINLMWLTVPLSVVISLIFSFIWLNVLQVPSVDITPHYEIGVWSVSWSCVIEMFAEPLHIISQALCFIKLKIIITAIAIMIRTIVFIVWIIFDAQKAVIAFSVAQLVANFFYSIRTGYFGLIIKAMKHSNKMEIQSSFNKNIGLDEKLSMSQYKTDKTPCSSGELINSLVSNEENEFPFESISDFFPKFSFNRNWLHPDSVFLTWSFFKQGILKQILTEGERYIMTLFSVMSFKEQGVYDVVNNLGSLVIRFIFKPVEESLYFYFTQTVRRNEGIEHQNQEKMKEASIVLRESLHLLIVIGLIIFIFGQSYSTLILYIYGGDEMASGEGPLLLKAHTFSVSVLAVNGITECYAFSTMSSEHLDRHNYYMAACSVLFLAVSWGLTQMVGGIGFILANCCNMLARIYQSVKFINQRYKHTPYKPIIELRLPKCFSVSLVIAFVLTKITETYCNDAKHFITGIISVLTVMIIWCVEKQDLLYMVIQHWNSKQLLKSK